MKGVAIVLLIIPIIVLAILPAITSTKDSRTDTDVINMQGLEGQGTEPLVKTFDNLLDGIMQVESGGDPWAVGDDGEAVGAYQIHKIYVDDVNRITKSWGIKARGGYAERYDKEVSRIMVEIYLRHYTKNLIRFDDMSYYELCARIHNGGPDGWRRDPEWFVRNRGYTLEQAETKIANTKAYWLKVKDAMEGGR